MRQLCVWLSLLGMFEACVANRVNAGQDAKTLEDTTESLLPGVSIESIQSYLAQVNIDSEQSGLWDELGLAQVSPQIVSAQEYFLPIIKDMLGILRRKEAAGALLAMSEGPGAPDPDASRASGSQGTFNDQDAAAVLAQMWTAPPMEDE